MAGRKFVSIVLCVMITLAAVPLTGFAGEVDKKTAADPAATLAQIEAMNLPEMPDDLAQELRGEKWWWYTYRAIQIIGDVQTVYTVSKWIWSWTKPTFTTCVYYGHAQSTPAYCY